MDGSVHLRSYISVMCVLGISGCQSVTDATGPLIFDPHLSLPATFEGVSLESSGVAEATQSEFAVSVYDVTPDSVMQFRYEGDFISGNVVSFTTPWEAQDAHDAASGRIWGVTRTSTVTPAETTLLNFETMFFYDEVSAGIFFHISRWCVILRVDAREVAPSLALRRGLRFSEDVFRVNDLLGTQPEGPLTVRSVEAIAVSGLPLVAGSTATFSVTVAYTMAMDEDVELIVRGRLEQYITNHELQSNSVTVPISRGRTTQTLELTLSLVDGQPGDEVEITGSFARKGVQQILFNSPQAVSFTLVSR